MPSFGKRVVVLLGMHRSGTSPITRGLKALGVELGEELLPPAPENPTGFWEDVAIQKLNDQLLTSINQVWDSMAPISRSAWSSPEVQTHMLEAVEIVRSRFGKFPLWGFKDPRTARLLPFWQALFGHLDLADSYVLIIRNPISVARSLKTRNNFALEKSYLLWLEHTILAYSETCGRQRVVVDYDALMAEPSAQLRRIAEKLALPLDASMEEAIKDYGDGFLQNSLRHSLFQASDVCLDAHATLLVGKTYDTLRQVALDRLDVDSKDVQSVLASARSGLEAFAPVHSYLERLERQLQDAIEQETLQAARSSKELADLQANLESERKQHLAVTAELESERKKYAEESESERKQHLAITADLEQVRAQYASVHKQNSHLNLRLRSADRFLQDLRSSPGWMVIVRYRGWVERQRSRHTRLFSRYEKVALLVLRRLAGKVPQTGELGWPLELGATDGSDGAAVAPQPAKAFIHKFALIISGCPGDALRYRCDHQAEELRFLGLTVDTALFDTVNYEEVLSFYQIFILHRVPHDSSVESFIGRAKRNGKLVVFDSDDLVFNEKLIGFVDAVKDSANPEFDLYLDGMRRYRRTLSLCSAAMVSTEPLSTAVRELFPKLPVYVNR